MSDYPKPDGWTGGAEGEYLNTFHGHVSSKYDRANAPISPEDARNCTDEVEDFAHQYDEGSDDTGNAGYIGDPDDADD